MEVIKKTIKQAVTTGTTTGCTGTTCYVIIPDLTAVYFMNICLKQQVKDWGFFDPYPYDYGGYGDYGENVSGIGEDLLLDDFFI